MSHLAPKYDRTISTWETLFTDENVPRQGDSINLPDIVELVIDSSSNFTDNINYFDEINIPESSKFTLDIPGKTFAFKKNQCYRNYTHKKWEDGYY